MAKKKTVAAVGIGAVVALAAYLFATSAEAAEPGVDDDDAPDRPPSNGERRPGKGPSGAPKPAPGGSTTGTPPQGASYTIPEDWDPIRGLWISPDCELVVEAPGWYCGSTGAGWQTPQVYGGFSCTAIEHASYVDTMAEPGNGVAGYVDFLIGAGWQPEDIAWQILTEVSPMCADLPTDMWGDGLWSWYQGFVERVIISWEDYQGIPFDPEAAA